MFRILSALIILIVSSSAIAQNTFTLSGHIQDSHSGEQLIGGTVYCEDIQQGIVSNIYGYYSLTLPEGNYTVQVTYIGYTTQRIELELNEDIYKDFNLVPGTTLSEAVVTGNKTVKIEDQVQMSKVEIPIDQIKRLPAIGGEVDLLKVLQLMPGVQSGNEGSSGLYVRGGSPDQNLMLLDGVPLYNVSHLFGFFSVFNADAVRNMTLTKGGYPARYGGRLSSILEIHMKDGNMKEYHVDGTVSIISSKLTVEGPLIEDKVSFMLSGRRTYLDLLLNPLIRMSAGSSSDMIMPSYNFYDFNGKINWKISEKDRLFFSAFNGRDKFGLETELNEEDGFGLDVGLNWSNQIEAIRWNHVWTPKLFSNATINHSKYNYNQHNGITVLRDADTIVNSLTNTSYINDYSAKLDFDYTPNPRHMVRFGANYTYHTFNPAASAIQIDLGEQFVIDSVYGPDNINSHESFLYAEDEFEIRENLKVNAGLHLSGLFVQGESYFSAQPRLALNYKLPGDVALKASYAEMTQFVNLLNSDGMGLQSDLWVPSTANITPQNSWQTAIGFAKTLGDFEVSIEGYYKYMDGLVSYKEGASFLNDLEVDWESKITQGVGNSYGSEFLVQKKYGKTTGWIGYTLSWSNRQFDDINSGNWYPFTYDRRHDLSVVLNHDFNHEWSGSFVQVYGTGRALTLADSEFSTYIPDPNGDGVLETVFTVPSGKNEYRMSPYHRVDLSLARVRPTNEGGEKHLIFSVYNVYNNLNPFFALNTTSINGNAAVVEYGLFPVIPSIAWRYKF
ncbi:MAG: hypothetical protein CL823_05405 [Crocinitomicaceae bacterium]|nr:hypothetical protein [Crocinitomicaceae bacterium]